MIKPKRLQRGDTIAIVALSAGMAGEPMFTHRLTLAIERMESEFGLNVVVMPSATKDIDYLYKNPEFRAKDLNDAFGNTNVKAIICTIGGDDTIRLLPYVNLNIIRENPKIFMGYSDSTINHFMMYKAGLTSFYAPCAMVEFAENGSMHDYTKKSIYSTLFYPSDELDIEPSKLWTSEFLDWTNQENDKISRKMNIDTKKYELLQGEGIVKGELLGGCIDVFPMVMGTKIFPTTKEWKDKILFLETSEEEPSPNFIKYILRSLIAQGIIDNISGIIVGKPQNETYYSEYKDIYKMVISEEANKPKLPILYNVNFGHTAPICILPYGILAEINCYNSTFKLLESAVI